jgi:pyruvate dehydrogenase E2 component (dihydrolipoamide acetyltransferase)
MAEYVTMPKLGFDMKEGTLVRWVKKLGDSINSGDIIAEIETDKATVEVEAYVSGTILKFLYEENSIVEIGVPIAVVGAAGESADNIIGGAVAPTSEKLVVESIEVSSSASSAAPSPNVGGNGYPEGVKASPLARRMAMDKGVDLSRVQGSGPSGRIIKRDVEKFDPRHEAPAAPISKPAPSVPVATTAPTYTAPTGSDIEEIALTRMRKIVGERTQASFQFVPHFYVTSEFDVAELLNLRQQINNKVKPEEKVTVNDLILKAVALALRDFPNLNSHFHGDRIVRHKRINVGIAVAVENGLINVVCKDADKRMLTDMAVKNKEMIANARDGRVKPDDVEGATFTVSNLGPYEVEHFLAIINPPESAILAVGSAREVPVVVNGEIKVGMRMKATISIDHRVSDGAEGAQFMQRLRELIENPIRLLI